MATSNVQILNSGDKTYLAARAIGTGAIAATDPQVVDVVTWPAGSEYVDVVAGIKYIRLAVSSPPVIGDWSKGAALTQLT
jgi:hypothetical protein